MKKILSIFIILVICLIAFAYNKITIFSIQPIGAIPEGTTIVMWKKENMNFFESPDGLCLKSVGNVSLMCRTMMIGSSIDEENIIFKLPYNERAYLLSTDGKEFDR